eukprot:763139-Hanusia_phi.AAC.3
MGDEVASRKTSSCRQRQRERNKRRAPVGEGNPRQIPKAEHIPEAVGGDILARGQRLDQLSVTHHGC